MIQVQLQEAACFHQDLWLSEEFGAQKLINLLQSIDEKKVGLKPGPNEIHGRHVILSVVRIFPSVFYLWRI